MPTISDPKKLPQTKTQFQLTFTADESTKAEETAVRRLGQNVSVPGFRPGKAPAATIRERLRDEAVMDETVRLLLPEWIGKLAQEHHLKPILAPIVEIESMQPITVKVTFVEKQAVTLKNLDGIKIEKKDTKVDEKDVQRMVDYVLDQHKTLTEVDRPAAEGDQVTMDFVGVDEQKNEIPGTRSSGYQAVIGSKTLIPGFEDELKGLKKNEEKSFSITFPEKYHAEHLRGKPATFSVTVTKVEEVNKPELTDEFAKQKLQADSAAGVRKRLEDSMKEQEQGLLHQKREEELFDALAKATNVELADELVEQEARAILLDLRDRLERQGASIEDWMQQTQRDEASLQKEMREQATKRLTLRFGLEEALKQKNIEVTDEEIEKLVADTQASASPEERAQMPRFERGTEQFEQLRWRRKVEKFVGEMLK